jgi:hypothetical protein
VLLGKLSTDDYLPELRRKAADDAVATVCPQKRRCGSSLLCICGEHCSACTRSARVEPNILAQYSAHECKH